MTKTSASSSFILTIALTVVKSLILLSLESISRLTTESSAKTPMTTPMSSQQRILG